MKSVVVSLLLVTKFGGDNISSEPFFFSINMIKIFGTRRNSIVVDALRIIPRRRKKVVYSLPNRRETKYAGINPKKIMHRVKLPRWDFSGQKSKISAEEKEEQVVAYNDGKPVVRGLSTNQLHGPAVHLMFLHGGILYCQPHHTYQDLDANEKTCDHHLTKSTNETRRSGYF